MHPILQKFYLEFQITNKYTIAGVTSPELGSTDYNYDEIDAESLNAINAALGEYVSTSAKTVVYRGIIPYDVDGANRQITFSVNFRSGTFTSVAFNTESAKGVSRYNAKRRAEIRRSLEQDTEVRRQAAIDIETKKGDTS